MALERPKWIADLSRSFKRHRLGRAGWSIEIKGERLRVVSSDLPPRPDEPPDSPPKRRAFTLTATPGPATASAALVEACKLFDLVMAGSWRWPDARAAPELSNPNRLGAAAIERLIAALRGELVGEKNRIKHLESNLSALFGRAYKNRRCSLLERRRKTFRDNAKELGARFQIKANGARSHPPAVEIS